MDVTQALKDAENALRDFIALTLSNKYSSNWINNCGVTEERLEKWKERKRTEEKRQRGGVVDERLIYYADFYDLRTILRKHWNGVFSETFGDLKHFEVLWAELEKLRDPDAHRRELLPHQKHFALGISGEIRTRIIRYRSHMETIDAHFPRIESVRDNLGNIWTPEKGASKTVITEMILRPGDNLEFVVTASDPKSEPLKYAVWHFPHSYKWNKSNTLSYLIESQDISKTFSLKIMISSNRPYHAEPPGDDTVSFLYTVLPML